MVPDARQHYQQALAKTVPGQTKWQRRRVSRKWRERTLTPPGLSKSTALASLASAARAAAPASTPAAAAGVSAPALSPPGGAPAVQAAPAGSSGAPAARAAPAGPSPAAPTSSPAAGGPLGDDHRPDHVAIFEQQLGRATRTLPRLAQQRALRLRLALRQHELLSAAS